jgi:nucleoside 2-deoxyribosyltransferase
MINVHLIASKSNVANDVKSLETIGELISSKGHHIVRNWVEAARTNAKDKDWAEIYQLNLETIAKADVVIAETSYNSFGVGYQVAVAIQQKKPTLLLRRDDADKEAFATGIVDTWAQRATYTDDNLDEIVEKFLHENDIATKDMRFNFFIDRPIYNYLRWSALKTGKTKAEILRELVQREIENKE